MPRARKQIKTKVYMPLPENKEAFQERVNQVCIESIENYLRKHNVTETGEVLKRLEQGDILFNKSANKKIS